MDAHLDYIENAHNFNSQNLTTEEVDQWCKVLFLTDKSLDEKKKALAILAHVGTLNAYQHLKKYAEHPDAGLEEWAIVALGECTLFLHSDLAGNDDSDFVFTGVGVNNNMLRFYFLLLPLEEKTIEDWQHKIIENELTYISRDLNCEIEWFDFEPNYACFSILMPTNVAIATFIEKGIINCNQFGGFLLEEYYCGTGVPDEKEIEEIIQIVRNGEEFDSDEIPDQFKPY